MEMPKFKPGDRIKLVDFQSVGWNKGWSREDGNKVFTVDRYCSLVRENIFVREKSEAFAVYENRFELEKELDLTKPVQTRSGCKVDLLMTEAKIGPDHYPLVGLVHSKIGHQYITSWSKNGKGGGGYLGDTDLINVPPPPPAEATEVLHLLRLRNGGVGIVRERECTHFTESSRAKILGSVRVTIKEGDKL